MGTKWRDAFLAMADHSPALVAGMAETISTTEFRESSSFVYYLVTEAGIHVGQKQPGGGFFARTQHVDHFVPRGEIVGIDTDFDYLLELDVRGERRVLLFLYDGSPQLTGQGSRQVSAVAQAELIANALGWDFERRPADYFGEHSAEYYRGGE